MGNKWSNVQLFCFFLRYIDWFRYVCWNDRKLQAWERVKLTASDLPLKRSLHLKISKHFFLDCTNYSPGWCLFFVRAYRKFIHWSRSPFSGAMKIGTRKNVVLEASNGKRGQEIKGGCQEVGAGSILWILNIFFTFENLCECFLIQHFDVTNKEFWTCSIRICKWCWLNVGFWQFLGVFP